MKFLVEIAKSRFEMFRKSSVYCLSQAMPVCLLLGIAFNPFALSAAQSKDSIDSHLPIPHSSIAQAKGHGIVKAVLSCATDRYAHGVLGDAIEAGCLVVEDDSGELYKVDLPHHQVFEDLDPRIADIDGDGQNDVVLVRSDADSGAALSVYSIVESSTGRALKELASTPTIGRTNRWLSPVGIADFNGDGAMDIAYVQTPHIAGTLKVWSIIDDSFQQIAESRGYSNHRLGDTRVSTAKVEDVNQDGIMDLALPNQSRTNIVRITLHPELIVLDSGPYSQSYFD